MKGTQTLGALGRWYTQSRHRFAQTLGTSRVKSHLRVGHNHCQATVHKASERDLVIAGEDGELAGPVVSVTAVFKTLNPVP